MYTSGHSDLVPHLLSPYDANNNDKPDLYLGAHGTHVAGIIGAVADQRGIIGAAPHVTLLPVRVFKWGESGRETATVDAIVRGIYYAMAQGAQVINMSFGMRDYDQTLHEAIKSAYAAGIVLVAASGNNGNGQVLYPAALPEVIAVGAVGPDGKRASYSQYGPQMELMAPGGNRQLGSNAEILSTYWDLETKRYTWDYQQGTSMAAPHVSAIAALLKSYGITDPDYIRLLLRDTARDMGTPGYDEETGYGLVDALMVMDRFQHTYVFFGNITSGHAQLKSIVAHVQTNGEYELSGARPGKGHVVGWIDINHNLVIDGGDYLGQSVELSIAGGTELFSGIQVNMKMVPGEFNAVDLHLQTP
jgi:serine protease